MIENYKIIYCILQINIENQESNVVECFENEDAAYEAKELYTQLYESQMYLVEEVELI